MTNSIQMPPIHFECPECGASHDRGFANGVDTFRCLRCGYSGHGWHADHDIDREIHLQFLEGNRLDVAAGLSPRRHEDVLLECINTPRNPLPLSTESPNNQVFHYGHQGH